MADCTKYTDMISGFADGELSENDKNELQKHLDECPTCRALLSAYRSVSEAAMDALAEPPGDFVAGVMQRIKALPENGRPVLPMDTAKSRKRKSYKPVVISFVAAAACLALVFLVSPQLFGFLGGNRTAASMPYAAPNAALDASAAASAAPAADSALQAPAAKQVEAGTGSAEIAQDYTVESTPQLMTGDSQPAASEQPQPSATPAPSAPIGVTSVATAEELQKYYAVISVKGQLPDILKEKAKLDNGDGTFKIEIPADIAEQLIKDGFENQPGNRDMATALVVYTPA